MVANSYADFDLEITRLAEGKYRAQVIDSPAGQASIEFTRPFPEMELENFILKIGRTRTGVRRIDSPEMRAAESFGKKLFEAVLRDEVRECLTSSLHQVDREEIPGLRINLRLVDVPELGNLPWEYLYHPTLRRFIVLSKETPIARYTNLPRPVTPLKVAAPLRLLAVVASPTDYPSLDVNEEKAKMRRALGDLEHQGLIVLEWLEEGTLSALQQRLRREAVHLLHFIGHGGWDNQAQNGVLLFEDEHRRGYRVSAGRLATILHDHRTLRLVVLNACEGARMESTDLFAGVATTLVQQGIPAVIAMQFEITDRAAIQLSQTFYESLADGYPAEAALAEARKAVYASGNDVEWGTPVLYLRASDGHLFDIDSAAIRQAERVAREKAEQERLAKEKAEADHLAALKVEEERIAQDKAEKGRLEKERSKAQRLAALNVEKERAAREKAEQERLAKEKAQADHLTALKAEEVPIAQEKAKQEKLAHERTEAATALRQQLRLPTRKWILSGLIVLGVLVGLYIIVSTPRSETNEAGNSATLAAAAISAPTPTHAGTSVETPPVTWTRPADGMTMVYVPPGTFKMGSETGSNNEKPIHDVTLDAFWLDQTEVTNAQYAKCVSAGKCNIPASSESNTRSSYYSDGQYTNYPVVQVRWEDADKYCAWVGGQLPTEAQWEYAARGPNDYMYPWGNDPPNSKLLNYSQEVGDTTRAGIYPQGASWVGAFDLAGNVGEWVQDWYGPYASSAQINPTGPTSGAYRVLRGGSFNWDSDSVRAAARFHLSPDSRIIYDGFRCARPPAG